MSRKVGPTNSSGLPVYSYLGCFTDDAPAGRLLPTQPYDNSSNTNGLCQTEAQAGNYIFAGTEYQTECWIGDTPPPSLYQADESYCTFSCAGDATQVCGGFGGYLSVYYDSSRYTPGNNTQPAGAPITVNQTGNYNYIGCYSEATVGRALSGLAPGIPAGIGNTIESCEASCQGYTYFGVGMYISVHPILRTVRLLAVEESFFCPKICLNYYLIPWKKTTDSDLQ